MSSSLSDASYETLVRRVVLSGVGANADVKHRETLPVALVDLFGDSNRLPPIIANGGGVYARQWRRADEQCEQLAAILKRGASTDQALRVDGVYLFCADSGHPLMQGYCAAREELCKMTPPPLVEALAGVPVFSFGAEESGGVRHNEILAWRSVNYEELRKLDLFGEGWRTTSHPSPGGARQIDPLVGVRATIALQLAYKSDALHATQMADCEDMVLFVRCMLGALSKASHTSREFHGEVEKFVTVRSDMVLPYAVCRMVLK